MVDFRLGMDLVDVREVQASLDRFGARYMSRVYTDGEIAYATRSPSETARRLGARFAAKEATLKALRAVDDGIPPTSIAVVRHPDGACEISLEGAALEAARREGIVSLSVSLTHEGDVAAAVVLAQTSTRTPRRGRIPTKEPR
jgi:holo-[acyl-carrier protein] synthase